MKKIKTFEEFSNSLQEDAIDAGEDSKVVVGWNVRHLKREHYWKSNKIDFNWT